MHLTLQKLCLATMFEICIIYAIILWYAIASPFYPDCYDNRYELMLSCWYGEPGARLNFTQLKYSFKSMIFASNPETSYVSIKPNVSSTVVVGDAPVSSQESDLEGQYERISAANVVPT